MLRHGDDHTSSWPNGGYQFTECSTVIVDVLQDVKRPGNVELILERQASRLRADEPRIGASGGDLQCRLARVDTNEANPWKSSAYRVEHCTGSAAHVEHASGARKVRLHGPNEKSSAGPEPEVPVLEVGEMLEGLVWEA
jgi:hypothetical protein